MKIQLSHWKICAAIILLLALVWPAQAARYRHYSNYQTATFQVSDTTQVAVGSNEPASLLGLRRGEHVSVVYDQENGLLVAHRITSAVSHNPKPLETHAKSTGHHQADYWSVHGVIESVNPQAGTLTIAYKSE
jgi:Cu/Ag efflux protein CusF